MDAIKQGYETIKEGVKLIVALIVFTLIMAVIGPFIARSMMNQVNVPNYTRRSSGCGLGFVLILLLLIIIAILLIK